jgi:hypothetical protein
MSANKYNGEINITLFHKVYPMKINMNVIAKFQSETGKDYMRLAIRSMNGLRKCVGLDATDQAEIMTTAVEMSDAAWLFYLAAKEMDKLVTFDEIQEAVLMEGPLREVNPLDSSVSASYPIQFTELVMFATLGVLDNSKKP